MAEEKKFLNEEMEKSNHKLMVKYIALSVVIFVILILCVLAWFTSKSEATARGINVQTITDDGLQVAIEESVKAADSTEYQKKWTSFADIQTYHSGFTATNPLPLISGDGLNLFEPSYIKVAEHDTDLLDLDSLGEAVNWAEVTSTVNQTTKNKSRYIEYKMKFRNTKPSNVFLRNDSEVSPIDSKENLNPWNFSRDYIAATSRVAFLKGSDDNLSFHSMWIPNDKIELTHTDRTETQVTSYIEKHPEGTVKETAGSLGGIPSGGTATEFYVWWNGTEKFTGGQRDAMVRYFENMNKSPLMDKGDYYYCKMTAPATGTSAEGDRAFFVTRPVSGISGPTIQMDHKDNGDYIGNKFDLTGTSITKQYVEIVNGVENYVTVQFMSDDYNIAYKALPDNNYKYVMNCEKVYVSPHQSPLDYYLIIDKQGKVIDIIIDAGLGGTDASYSVDINNSVYVPKNRDVLLISASNSTDNYGLSSTNTKISAESVGNDPSGADVPTWKVVVDVGDNSGSFKLFDTTKEKYLAMTATGLDLNDTGTNFYAVTKYEKTVDGSPITTKLNGVMLYSLENNKFVTFDGTTFTLSNTYDTTNEYHIYLQETRVDVTEGGWGLELNGKTEEKFYYKKANVTGKQELNKYFLSSDIVNNPTYNESESVATYPNFIVAVNNLKSDGYYESDEITVRIWGEGYDREAQTPVEGGRMKINLHFFAVEDE